MNLQFGDGLTEDDIKDHTQIMCGHNSCIYGSQGRQLRQWSFNLFLCQFAFRNIHAYTLDKLEFASVIAQHHRFIV